MILTDFESSIRPERKRNYKNKMEMFNKQFDTIYTLLNISSLRTVKRKCLRRKFNKVKTR